MRWKQALGDLNSISEFYGCQNATVVDKVQLVHKSMPKAEGSETSGT